MTDVIREYELDDGTVMQVLDEYETDHGTKVKVEREKS